jgi:membrane protein DedA with SNARE-associated domain
MPGGRQDRFGDFAEWSARSILRWFYSLFVIGSLGVGITSFATHDYSGGAGYAGFFAVLILVPLTVTRVRLRRYKKAARDHTSYGAPRF